MRVKLEPDSGRILFFSNSLWSIWSFRRELLLKLKQEGFNIVVMGEDDGYLKALESLNFKVISIKVNNHSKNPFKDLLLLFKVYLTFKKESPDIILQNAIKPNIYGSIAARFLRIPVINNISGLATSFIADNFVTKLSLFLYKLSQKEAHTVFFQNSTDLLLMRELGIVLESNSLLLPGSGVDLNKYRPKLSYKVKEFTFVYVGRLLNDKGIRELYKAFERLAKVNDIVRLKIIGDRHVGNSNNISDELYSSLREHKKIDFIGFVDDVRKELSTCDFNVLPSYREGLSRSLLEASAMAIPSIASDVPGCKDVIENNYNGLLVSARSEEELFNIMKLALNMSVNELRQMGINARHKVESDYSIEKVHEKYIERINIAL